MSEREPELGLGVVASVDAAARRIAIDFPGTGEKRLYALGTAVLKRVQFRAGETVTTRDGTTLTIESVEEKSDLLTYVGAGRRVREDAIADGTSVGLPPERLLAALARPAYRHQLERLPELESELRAFGAARFDLLIPVRGEHGLQALVVLEELHGQTLPHRAALESLEALCSIAAIAVTHAVRDRATAALSVQFAAGPPAPAALEAAEILARAVRFVPLPPRFESMVRIAVRSRLAALTRSRSPAG